MSDAQLNTGPEREQIAQEICQYLPLKDIVAGKKVLDLNGRYSEIVSQLLNWGAAQVDCLTNTSVAKARLAADFSGHSNVMIRSAGPAGFVAAHGADYDVIIGTDFLQENATPDRILAALAGIDRGDTVILLSSRNDVFTGMTQRTAPRSFYDFRTASEEALGAASWYLGTSSTGFAAVSADRAVQSPEVPAPTQDPAAVLVSEPVPTLKPSNSLFFCAIWSGAELRTAYSSLLPRGGDQIWPVQSRVPADVALGKRRRAAFVIDQHGWAFDNIVDNITPYLAGQYEISVYCIADYSDPADLLNAIFVENTYDNVHYMWREAVFWDLTDSRIMLRLLDRSGLSVAKLVDRLAAPVLTTSVYDHMHLQSREIEQRQSAFASVDGYAVSSPHLMAVYQDAYDAKPAVQISDGVDLETFAKARAIRAGKTDDGVFRIGWVGNSTWGQGKAGLDHDPKGLETVLIPAVERLVMDGFKVSLELADRNLRYRSRAEMVEYYGGIDVLVCASQTEGTPNPVLEAMASGTPFVSTDVGIVTAASGPEQTRYILSDRTPDAMFDALVQLIGSKRDQKALAAENLRRVAQWDWSRTIPNWLKLLNQAQEHHLRTGRQMRQITMRLRYDYWHSLTAIDTIRGEVGELKAQLSKAATKQATATAELQKVTKSLSKERKQHSRLRAKSSLEHVKDGLKRRVRKWMGGQ